MKKRKSTLFVRREKGALPPEVLALMQAQGIDTSGFLYAVTGDMNDEGEYMSAWIAFDKKGLYIATGEERIVPVKGSRRLKVEYRLNTLQTHPRDSIGNLSTETYMTTARLLSEKDGEVHPLIRFSLGLMSDFSDFCKAWKAVSDDKDLEEVKKGFSRPPFCPDCGMRYPDPKRRVCPRCMDKSSIVKRLFSFFGSYWSKVLLIISSMLAGTLISVLMPKISTQYLYDNVLNAGNLTPVPRLIASLGWLVLAIAGIRLLALVLNMLYQYFIAGLLPWVIYDIRLKIFAAMQRLSVGFYTSKQTGALMQRVTNDSTNIYWFFVDGMPNVIASAATIIGVSVMMFLMNWKLALMAVVLLPAVVLLFVPLDRFFHKLWHKRWARSAALSSLVSDNINGQRVIKAFSKEKEESGRFAAISGRLLDSEVEVANTDATAYPLIYLLMYIVMTIVFGIGGVMVIRGELTLGELLTFIIYMNMLQNPLDFMSWVSNWWARCVNSAQRVFEVIDTEPDVKESENPVTLDEFKGEIEISELEFEYEPARPVIKRLNLKVEAGQMLGIVGKTGAGKTTIANLIARLYDAKAGSIKIDGVDVKDLSMSQLRENVGLVSQDIYLFMGTIADNIRYARPDATIEEVIAAAKAASAHDFIMKLPDTYETRVGAGGQDLSGGERQRISIARTIIQNPKILILDEATAAMDTETERNIQQSLARLKEGRTTLAIAHRLSTLRDADMLCVIDDGKVVEYGSYAELMRKRGEYYKLYKIQSEALKYVGIGDE